MCLTDSPMSDLMRKGSLAGAGNYVLNSESNEDKYNAMHSFSISAFHRT